MELFASLVAGDLLVEARGSHRLLRLDWTGRSNARHPGLMLAPWFEAVLERARLDGCGIEAHFEALEFFNSSTIGAVIQFISEARERGIELSLLFDARLHWQALSFDALKTFELEDGLVRIRSVPDVPEPFLSPEGERADARSTCSLSAARSSSRDDRRTPSTT